MRGVSHPLEERRGGGGEQVQSGDAPSLRLGLDGIDQSRARSPGAMPLLDRERNSAFDSQISRPTTPTQTAPSVATTKASSMVTLRSSTGNSAAPSSPTTASNSPGCAGLSLSSGTVLHCQPMKAPSSGSATPTLVLGQAYLATMRLL